MKQTLSIMLTFLLTACATSSHPPLPRPDSVDLNRFMGDWYVIGFIPLPPEKDAWNGIESYALNSDGSIATTYRFRANHADGELKTYTPTAEIVPGTDNTQWKMQFLWPFKADYRIAYVSEDYSITIIARDARDYVWLMARQPQLSAAVLADMESRIGAMGHNLEEFIYQPQRWPEAEPRP